jgi:transcriptional regulator GlxA family with amidase domain
VTAGVDLLLHTLRKDLAVRRQPRRQTDRDDPSARRRPSAVHRPGTRPPGDDEISAAQQWMLANLDAPITVQEIAAQVGLGTPANLRAHFRRTTPLSPRRHRQLFSQG